MNARHYRYLLVLAAAFAPLTAAAYVVSTTSYGAEIKWSVRNVSYLINESSGPSGASTAIQAAMNTWSTVSGATFQYTSGGSTSGTGGSRDYQNICSFGYLGTDGTVAQNTFWFNPTTGVESESDVVFNTYYSWSVTGAAGAFDLQNIATHELGHALSLDDLYGSGDTEKTMYGYASKGETKKRTLDADDMAGIVYLYPYISTVPAVTLSLTGSPMAEAGGVATVTATLSAVYSLPVTANLSFSGTATLTSDYTRSGTSITIPAGSLSGSITLTAVQDSLDEPNETIQVDISSVVNGTENGTQYVTATITDDDPPPSVTLGLTGSPMVEAGGVATVTATLSARSGYAVIVNLAFSGTATLTTDYTRSGTSITIPAGSLSGSITLTAVQDTVYEGNETIVVDISSVSNGTETGTQQVTAIITDDDLAPTITTQPASKTVAVGGTATFTVAASGATPISYFWRRNGTPILGANASSYTTNNVQLADSGAQFSCLVSNAYGTVVSSSAGLTVTPVGSVRIALYGANEDAYLQDVKAKIVATGLFQSADVDVYSAESPASTPTLTQLQQYAAVLTWSDATYTDNIGMGNVLADYVDAGGGVTLAACAFETTSYGIDGRIATGGYLPFSRGSGLATGVNMTLVSDLPAHFLLQGISAFDGGSESFHDDISLASGATLVAHWSNGRPLVGTKEIGGHRVVGLNMWPVSSDAVSYAWLSSTDGGRIMANALLWAANSSQTNTSPTIVTQPASQTVAAGGTATFSVAATGSTPLSYFWRRNGTPIAGANGTNYTANNVQLSDSGAQFSCLVSNAYGTVVSSSAVLTVVPAGSVRIALFGADDDVWLQDVKPKIMATGLFQSADVDVYSAVSPASTPTLSQLQQYAAVLTWSDSSYTDNIGMGNVLADYVDGGGGLVVAAFAFATISYGIDGRIATGGYLPFIRNSTASGTELTLVKDLPGHFLLQGVSTFDGGAMSFHNDTSLASGASLVAHWSNGQPLIGTKEIGGHRVVGLNMWPVSSDAYSGGWLSSTDGGRIMANALLWAANRGGTNTSPTIVTQPASQTVAVGGAATFSVTATGSTPLNYFWRRNGAPIAGANASSYTLNNAQLSDSGFLFSCLVSNAFGTVTSSNALLTVNAPALDHFAWSAIGSPQTVGSSFPVNITAKDSANTTVPGFVGTVTLSASAGGGATNCILGNVVDNGAPGNYGTFTLGYAFTPNATLQVTHVRHYSGSKVSIWTDSGVLLASRNVSSVPGTWVETPLEAPVTLTAGTRYRVGFYTAGTTYYNGAAGVSVFSNGTIDQSYEVAGDNFPSSADVYNWWFVDLRYTVGASASVPIAPTVSGTFLNGVWSGSLAVQQAASNVVVRADDGSGHSGLSNPFTVAQAATAPIITSQPASQSIFVGGNATFNVTASGSAPLSYFWRRNGTPIAGATGTSYTANNVQLSDSGAQFSCLVSNAYGTTTSQVATLTVTPVAPPGLTMVLWGDNYFGQTNSPLYGITNAVALAATLQNSMALLADATAVGWASNSQAVVSGGSSLVAIDGGWYDDYLALKFDGTVLLGSWESLSPAGVSNAVAVSEGIEGEHLALRDDGTVAAWGANGYGQANVPSGLNKVVAVAAAETQCLALRADGTVVAWGNNSHGETTVPAGLHQVVAIAGGYGFSLALKADGTVIKWGSNGTVPPSNLSNVVAIAAAEEMWTCLKIDGSVADFGNYYGGTPTGVSNAMKVAAGGRHFLALRGNQQPPQIYGQPRGLITQSVRDVLVRVEVVGSVPLSYQWRSGGSAIAGATNAWLLLTDVSGMGTYTVVVSNPYGSVESLPATVGSGAGTPPAILAEPQSVTLSVGGTATFSISASGTAPLSYFWRRNGSPIAGATASNYTTNNVHLSDSGAQFSCLVSNAYGTTLSSNATLTVVAPPTIVVQPQSVTANVAAAVTFSVTASGTAPLSYYWRRNGNPVAGATASSYTTNNVQLADSGAQFSCLVSNAYGTALSSSAVLTVQIAAPLSFAAPALITVPSFGAATPYPSTNLVAGVVGTVVKASVTLSNINHTYPDDLDILLVGPSGQTVMLMSDAGGLTALVNVTLTFDSDAANALPDSAPITTGTWRPTDYESGDVLPVPAPAGPYGTNLAVFNGLDPNGAWRLFVADDTDGDSGKIANGWMLQLTVASPAGNWILPPRVLAGNIQLQFATTAGQSYEIQYKNSLKDKAWQTLQTVVGDGSTMMVQDSISSSAQRFYRLQVQ